MKNCRLFIFGLIVILLVILLFISNYGSKKDNLDEPNTPNNTKLKAIDCLPEQRNVDACIEIYQPVCGQVQVQCIKTPCNPIKETFENSCKACVNPLVISYTQGECQDNEEIKK